MTAGMILTTKTNAGTTVQNIPMKINTTGHLTLPTTAITTITIAETDITTISKQVTTENADDFHQETIPTDTEMTTSMIISMMFSAEMNMTMRTADTQIKRKTFTKMPVTETAIMKEDITQDPSTASITVHDPMTATTGTVATDTVQD